MKKITMTILVTMGLFIGCASTEKYPPHPDELMQDPAHPFNQKNLYHLLYMNQNTAYKSITIKDYKCEEEC